MLARNEKPEKNYDKPEQDRSQDGFHALGEFRSWKSANKKIESSVNIEA